MFHVEHLSAETKNRFDVYRNLLIKWQRAINLVSRGTLSDFWTRHIADSLQLLPFLRGNSVLDIGSGAGFPGMVIAIAFPQLRVTCIDSDKRKIQFLSEVARLTGLAVELVSDRIQNLDAKFDTVVARGFAKLEILLELTLKHSGYGVFLKGAKLEKEIEESRSKFRFHYEVYKSETDNSGRIIVVRDIVRNDG